MAASGRAWVAISGTKPAAVSTEPTFSIESDLRIELDRLASSMSGAAALQRVEGFAAPA